MSREPLFAISVAARLCGVHPQTLRAYERLGLISPARLNEKNRVYSEDDIRRIRQIQRLTQDLGVNLAGVEVILKLLDQMEDMRGDMEMQLHNYVREAEMRLSKLLEHSTAPVRRDEQLLPIPRITINKKIEF